MVLTITNFYHTYEVTSVGGVKATLVALPSVLPTGKSIELRVTVGFGEPGWKILGEYKMLIFFCFCHLKTYFGVVNIDVNRILEWQVVGLAVVGEWHDFNIGIVKSRESQFRAVGWEPHSVIAAENLLWKQKWHILFTLSLRAATSNCNQKRTFVHPVWNTVVHFSWYTVGCQFVDCGRVCCRFVENVVGFDVGHRIFSGRPLAQLQALASFVIKHVGAYSAKKLRVEVVIYIDSPRNFNQNSLSLEVDHSIASKEGMPEHLQQIVAWIKNYICAELN